mgnify:CR=1 FL=1
MQPVRGILFKCTALFLFMVMSVLVKATSDTVPPGQQVFFRSFFAMPIIFIWLYARGDLSTGFRVESRLGHFWRGLIGASAMGMGFASLGLLPLPEVTAIGFASPIITVILAALLLGERFRLVRMTAVLVGLVGVTIVLWPRLSVGSGAYEQLALLGALLALGSAALRALAQIHIRRLVQTEQTSAIVFYFSLTTTCLSLLTLPFGWVMPDAATALMLVCAGLIGGVAQIFLTSGYKYADASVLAPFDYTSMLYALVFGYFLFAEVPTVPMLIGSGLVIGAGGLIIWRERQLGLQRGKARPGMTPQG